MAININTPISKAVRTALLTITKTITNINDKNPNIILLSGGPV